MTQTDVSLGGRKGGANSDHAEWPAMRWRLLSIVKMSQRESAVEMSGKGSLSEPVLSGGDRSSALLENTALAQAAHLTGLIAPATDTDLMRIWFWAFHAISLSCILMCIIAYMIQWCNPGVYDKYEVVTGFDQYLVMNPATYFILWRLHKEALNAKFRGNIEKTRYLAAVWSTRQFFIAFLTVFGVVSFLPMAAAYILLSDNTMVARVEAFSALTSYETTTLLQAATLVIFVAEQRLLRAQIQDIKVAIQNGTLTAAEYLSVHTAAKCGQHSIALNTLVGVSLANVMFALLAVLVPRRYSAQGAFGATEFAVVTFALFGREIFTLLLLLLEIAEVNALGDSLGQLLVTQAWKEGSHQEQMRLYVTIKEFPLGSNILFQRWSRSQLILRCASIVVGIVTSVTLRIVLDNAP